MRAGPWTRRPRSRWRRATPAVELTDDQWLEGVSGAGINQVALEHLVHLWRYLRTGGPDDPNGYRVTPTIETLGGAAPLALRALGPNVLLVATGQASGGFWSSD